MLPERRSPLKKKTKQNKKKLLTGIRYFQRIFPKSIEWHLILSEGFLQNVLNVIQYFLRSLFQKSSGSTEWHSVLLGESTECHSVVLPESTECHSEHLGEIPPKVLNAIQYSWETFL